MMLSRLISVLFLLEKICANDGTQEDLSTFCFPDDFLLGSATAAQQVEGGWNETGRGWSIWDQFCRDRNISCSNVADDFINRYHEDIERMMEMGLRSFRFSISWPRVMTWSPSARKMVPNIQGLVFYHNLINALKTANIEPLLTMYHWDLPQELNDKDVSGLQGWLSPKIADHFLDYADLLFNEFGTSIHFWSTFNEPWTFVAVGYGLGVHAPGLTNSTTYAYTAAHNVLLSHAKAVSFFRKLQKEKVVSLEAQISIVLNVDFAYPYEPTNPSDVSAAERQNVFKLDWFLDPIVYGKYPAMMLEGASGSHMQNFTEEEAELLKGSYDIFMLNHYTSNRVTSCSSVNSTIECDDLALGYYRDMGVDYSQYVEGARLSSINAEGHHNCDWFSGYPPGYLEVIRRMHSKNTTAKILLTENGWCGNATVDNQDQLWYYQEYLKQVGIAMRDYNIPIIGYTAWSLVDNYEWGSFEPRFGLYYVDYPQNGLVGSPDGYTPLPDQLSRVPRPAAFFLREVAHTMCVDIPAPPDKGFSVGSIVLSILIAALLFSILFYFGRMSFNGYNRIT